MPQKIRAQREEIKAQADRHEKTLAEARSSAALGGHSRALLLHLERKLHQVKKDLALLDSQASLIGPRLPDA